MDAAKVAALTVSEKFHICDASTKLNRIPYTPPRSGGIKQL